MNSFLRLKEGITQSKLNFTFLEIIELEVPKSETLAFLNHAIHEALDPFTYSSCVLNYKPGILHNMLQQ